MFSDLQRPNAAHIQTDQAGQHAKWLIRASVGRDPIGDRLFRRIVEDGIREVLARHVGEQSHLGDAVGRDQNAGQAGVVGGRDVDADRDVRGRERAVEVRTPSGSRGAYRPLSWSPGDRLVDVVFR